MKFSWNKKKVLITGHSGFIGQWFTLLLNKKKIKNYGVSLKSNKSRLFKLLHSGKNSYFFDINNFEKLDKLIFKIKPDIIIHLAAEALVLKSYKNPLEAYKTNIFGTLNLLRVIKKYNFIKTGVFFTTDKVYENKDNGKNFKENDKLSGDDPYSGSKAASEIVINSFTKSFPKREKNYYLRAGNIIGGGDYTKTRLIPDIIRSHLNKSIMRVRSPNSIRPWQHVVDIAYITLKIIEKTFKKKNYFEKFNIGPQKSNFKVKKIITEFEKELKFKKIILKKDKLEKKILKLNSNKILKKFGLKNKISTKNIHMTIKWYKNKHQYKKSALELCEDDFASYNKL